MSNPIRANREFFAKAHVLASEYNYHQPVRCRLDPSLCELCARLIEVALSTEFAAGFRRHGPDFNGIMPENPPFRGSVGYKRGDLDSIPIYAHYATRAELEASSRAGCSLCDQICAGVVDADGPVDLCLSSDDYTRPDWQETRAPNVSVWRKNPEMPGSRNHHSLLWRLEFLYANDTAACLTTPSRIWGQTRTTPPTSPLSGSALAQMKSWQKDCRESHPSCTRTQVAGDGPLHGPRRLVRLSRTDANTLESMRLVDTSSLVASSQEVRYAALSYCWGRWDGLKTTRANIADMRLSIPLRELPYTIQDAAAVCIHSDISLLWVDSLCICQDDPDDWRAEALKMANVYGGAEFVVSALSGSGAGDGFLGLRDRGALYLGAIKPPAGWPVDVSALFARRIPMPVEVEIGKSPLSRRAWALQERALARAVLHFGSDQLLWECDTLKLRSETGETSMNYPSRLRISKDFPGPISPSRDSWFLWGAIVCEFTRRAITLPSDRLPAVAGLAAELQRRGLYAGKYAAGMWEDHLAVQLLWHSDRTEDLGSCEASAPRDQRVPSWSWAHWHIPSQYSYLAAGVSCLETPPAFQSIDWNPSVALAVDNAVLLRCHLKEATWTLLQKVAPFKEQLLCRKNDTIKQQGRASWYIDENASPLEKYYCLRLFECEGLHRKPPYKYFHYLVVRERKNETRADALAVTEEGKNTSASLPHGVENLFSRIGLMVLRYHEHTKFSSDQDLHLTKQSRDPVLFGGRKASILLI